MKKLPVLASCACAAVLLTAILMRSFPLFVVGFAGLAYLMAKAGDA